MDVLQMYREAGALHEGHFLLRSGRHSPMFMQSVTLMQHPLYADAIGEAIGRLFEGARLDFVIGPAMGGVTLAFVVARALGVRALFAEKDGQGGMYVREGLLIRPGERFLAVEDVITTGSSVKRAIEAAEAKGARCIGVGGIVDRSGGKANLGVPFKALTALEFPAYDPGDCPLCRQGIALLEI